MAQEKEASLKELQVQQAVHQRAAKESKIAYEQSQQKLVSINRQLEQLAMQLDPIASVLVKVKTTVQDSPAVHEVIVEVEKVLNKARAKQQEQLQTQKEMLDSAAAEQKKVHETQVKLAEQMVKPLQEVEKADVSAKGAAESARKIKQRDTDVVARTEKKVNQLAAEHVAHQGIFAEKQQIERVASDDLEQARSPIVSATFSPDGRQCAIGNLRHRLFVYDAHTGRPLDRCVGRGEALVLASYIDNRQLATIDNQRQLIAWDMQPHWKLHRTLGSPTLDSPIVDRVLALDFSPDGKLLAIGSGEPSRSGQITIWNVADGTLQKELSQPHDDTVFALAFSPDGQFLASSSADRLMKVFRVANGQVVRTFEGHTHHALDVSWRANGKQLATSGADKLIKIWDYASGEQLRTIRGPGKEITAISFLGSGNQLVSVSGDRQIRIHNIDDGKQVRAFSSGADYLYCCAVTEIGDTIVTGSADMVLRVWNAVDGKERFEFKAVTIEK
jgi:hypothetical protein